MDTTTIARPRKTAKKTITLLADPMPLDPSFAYMETRTELVTPDTAVKWLEQNKNNRDIRQSKVEEYAAAMARGEWRLTHQGIAFDTQGNLLDGQHRLWAIVESRVAVPLRVTYNASPDTFSVLDTGVKRTLADLTRAPRHVVEVASRIARVRTGTHLSAQQIEPYLKAFGPAADQLFKHYAGLRRGVTTAGVRAGAVLRMVSDPSSVEYTLDQYANLARLNLTEVSPVVMALYKRLQDARQGDDEVVLLAYRAFDPKRASGSKMQLKYLDDVVADTRALIDNLLKKGAK